MNSHNLKRWDVRDFRDVPEILKEREGDNLGDGKFSGFQEMGISLNEVFPFLSGDGKFSGFQEMGISLNEVFPFLSGDGKFLGFPNFNISK